MKTNKLLKSLLIVVTAVLPLTVRATDIPLSVGNYLTTSESVTTGTINNNDKGNLGGIKKEATATFTLANASAQDMVLTFLTGTQNAGSNPQVTVTLNNGTSDVFAQTIDVEGTSNWTPATKHIFELGNVPAGTYSLKFAFSNTSGYVCNLGSIGIYNKTDFDATLDVIPGDITLTNGVYNGPKTENDGANVGYVQNGGKAAYTFYSSKEGAYDMTLDIYRYNQGGTMNVKIVDLATGIADYNQDYAIANDAAEIASCKAVMHIAGASARVINLVFSDETTGLSVELRTENGEFATATWYTIDGRKVAAPTKKGIYIMNGRKVVVK